MNPDKLSMAIQLYQYVKSLTLLAEEHELKEWKTFLQPGMEQRSAFDHIMRAMAAEQNLLPEDFPSEEKSQYINKNLEKAIGHLYRAFFDAADWISIVLRENIDKAITQYDNECIVKVIPEYYKTIRPDITQISSTIAEIRDAKDISIDNTLIDQAEHYREEVNKLLAYYKTILSKVSSLEEFKGKQRKKVFMAGAWQIFLVVVSIVVGAIVTYLLSLIW